MNDTEWTTIIRPRRNLLGLNIKELYAYRELIGMFTKRFFTTMYKQTILGPLWIIINPLITTVLFTIVFGNIAQMNTDGIPQFLFYLSGTTMWSLFSTCINYTANIFIANQNVLGKVYFPRFSLVISNALCALINFFIQFTMFLVIYLVYLFTGAPLQPNWALLLVPLTIFFTTLLGISVGTIVNSLTTKYKDLAVLATFAVQLWMYATPIVYPISSTGGYAHLLLMINPMTPIMELFRFAFTGAGEVNWGFLGLAAFTSLALFFISHLLFNRIEDTFVDTI